MSTVGSLVYLRESDDRIVILGRVLDEQSVRTRLILEDRGGERLILLGFLVLLRRNGRHFHCFG